MKKSMIVSCILALCIIGVAILLAANPWGNTGPGASEATTKTVTGKLACLPKPGDGPHTLECAIGLRGDDDNYYALKHNPQPQTDMQSTVRVSGTYTAATGEETYDIKGTIDVKHFTVVSE